MLGDINLYVNFDDDKDFKIKATFKTSKMAQEKPLELAGIGFLQVIQIFSYLIYFEPRLLLIDEPDSHLHPDIQEKLITTLIKSARSYDTQVVLTTHSPNVVRSLDLEATLLWMKDGDREDENIEDLRKQMGWGLLDKEIILLTEDKKTGMLNNILSQWPSIKNKVSIWPAKGNSKLPGPDVINSLKSIFGNKIKILLHRDSDFMLPEDKEFLIKEYIDNGLDIWFTYGSDIESYWLDINTISDILEISNTEAEGLLERACKALDESDDTRKKFNTKRKELGDIIKDYKSGDASQESADVALNRFCNELGEQYTYVGKDLLKKLSYIANYENLLSKNHIGVFLPSENEIARDLKNKLLEVLDNQN